MKVLCYTLILCGSIAQANVVGENKTIELVGEVFPPATNKDGTGQQFEMVKAIFGPLGYKININVYPYKRALTLVETANADIMVGMLKSNDESLIYSNYPHDADKLLAVHTKEKGNEWQGIDSLGGKRVVTFSGLSKPIKQYLPNSAFKLREVSTRKQAMQKLLFDRIDYVIDCECGYLLDEVSEFKDRLATQEVGLLKIYLAFAKNEQGKKLKAIWDRAFPEYIRSEQAKDIYQKWDMLREYQIIQSAMENEQL